MMLDDAFRKYCAFQRGPLEHNVHARTLGNDRPESSSSGDEIFLLPLRAMRRPNGIRHAPWDFEMSPRQRFHLAPGPVGLRIRMEM